MKIQKFQRKPFEVEGVRVTKDNMVQVAEWCGGEVRKNAKGVKHIFIDVHRPMTERQTMAFVGDWILFADRGYKIYTQNAFARNFELVEAGTGKDHSDYDLAKPLIENHEEDTPLEFPKPKVPKQRDRALTTEELQIGLQNLRQHFKPEVVDSGTNADNDPGRP